MDTSAFEAEVSPCACADLPFKSLSIFSTLFWNLARGEGGRYPIQENKHSKKRQNVFVKGFTYPQGTEVVTQAEPSSVRCRLAQSVQSGSSSEHCPILWWEAALMRADLWTFRTICSPVT